MVPSDGAHDAIDRLISLIIQSALRGLWKLRATNSRRCPCDVEYANGYAPIRCGWPKKIQMRPASFQITGPALAVSAKISAQGSVACPNLRCRAGGGMIKMVWSGSSHRPAAL